MINPYGDDDEDFDLNFLLNRHAKVINLGTNIVTRESCPPLSEDHLLPTTTLPQSPMEPKHKTIKRKISQTLTSL